MRAQTIDTLTDGIAPTQKEAAAAGRTRSTKKTGTLLPGNMATLHETDTAQRIMSHFLSAVTAEGFTEYGEHWLGRDAVELLQAGRRLSQAEQAPPSFDIPQRWDWDRAGSIDGVHVDFTAVRADGSAVRVMLVETLADGVTPTPEALEWAAFVRAARPNDELRLVPREREQTPRSSGIAHALHRAIAWARGQAGRGSRR